MYNRCNQSYYVTSFHST